MNTSRFITPLLALSGLARWAIALSLLSAFTVTAQTNSEEQSVRLVHQQVLAALRQHDGLALQRLLSADFSAVDPDGSLSNKAAFIRAFGSAGSFPPLEESNTRLQFYGSATLLTTQLTYVLNGAPGASFQSTFLYAKADANHKLTHLQVTPQQKKQQKNALQEVQALQLSHLSGTLPTFYSPGHEGRAAEYQSLLTDCLAFYKNQLGLTLEVSLAVLTKDDWGKAAPTRSVYAVPFVTSPPSVAFLPATDDNVLTADVLSYRHKLPPQTRQQFVASGYTFAQGAEQMIGLIGLHELGHVYTNTYGISPRSRWFNEFLASYFALAFLHQQRPRLAQLLYAMSDVAYVDGELPQHTSLADFERLYDGLGAKNYDWYQKQFNKRIAQVYAAKGITFLTDVKNAFPAIDDKMTSEEEMQRLEKICPGFRAWADRLTQLASLTPAK